jgi:UDP-N-acetylmuramate-alanine ligase
VRAEYEEAAALLERDLPVLLVPRSARAGCSWQGAHNIVVAGTHGKTTTTAITAWLLDAAGLNPGFLVGGIAKQLRPHRARRRRHPLRDRGRRVRHRVLRQGPRSSSTTGPPPPS